MEDVWTAAESASFPSPIFFHQASVEAGKEFFALRAPGSRAVSDPEGRFFDAFGLRRGSLGELLGPRVWLRALRAVTRGHFVGRPRGDSLRMPGALLIRDGMILWEHRARHAGDQPDLEQVYASLDALRPREAG
ncbi:MAG: AhpC/TSA family protein [Planctomycetota bacterium]